IILPPALPAQALLLLLVDIDVRDLSDRVHAGVGAAGHHEARIPAQDAGDRTLERALNGAQPRLLRPAPEVRAVVGDIEPDAHALSLPSAPLPTRTTPARALRATQHAHRAV